MNKQKFTSLAVLMSSVLLLQGDAVASQKEAEYATQQMRINTVNQDLSAAIQVLQVNQYLVPFF